ncbi:non-canonical purine NTP pyrophosphatase [Enterobacter sichuanensis]|uniref:non-canonical purine NTP pyrophosphatase n=1 Tax=Enterobacter sichuanensis TaxID=2071710 RepID=UPI0036D38D23
MSEYAFYGKNGFKYGVDKITSDALAFHKRNILQLLKEIKGIDVDESYFINDDNRYLWREQLSYFCVYNNKIIGVIFSYFKKSDDNVPFDSVYVHRLVINPEHRNNSVAEHLLQYCIKTYFETIPWLKNISIQVTSNPKNEPAISLYSKIGFTFFGIKKYKNKTDSLLLLQSTNDNHSSNNSNIIHNPRLPSESIDIRDAKFYFSTSSEEKRKQFSWLFSLYNLNLDFYNISNLLIEPQVDSPTIESEKMLVSHPIKFASRFIKKKPFIVEDTMLFIEEFNQDYDLKPELPGLDTKRWWRQLGNDGVLRLLSRSKKRKAKYVSQIGCYLNAKQYYFGRGELHGVIAQIPRISEESKVNFPKTNPWFFHQIFIPDGYDVPLSLLSASDFTMIDYRRKALENLLNNLHDNIHGDSEQLRLI